MDKQEIRESILEERNKLDKKTIAEKSNIIKQKLFSLDEYKKAKTVMFFCSFGKEIYTHPMIKEALEEKTVVIPKIVDFEIVPCIIKDFKNLELGKYRILEPKEVVKANINDIELVLVPGVAFDNQGYRIGYGKGYYDAFLKKTKAKKIGLCMDFQKVEKIPKEEWDIKMDEVISES